MWCWPASPAGLVGTTITFSSVIFVAQQVKAFMSRITLALLLLIFAVSGLAMTARAQQDPPPEEASQPQPEPSMTVCQPDRILVKVQDGVDAATVAARYGGTL